MADFRLRRWMDLLGSRAPKPKTSVDLRVDLELEETESPSRPAATPPIETVDLRAPAEGLDDESEDEDGAAARR